MHRTRRCLLQNNQKLIYWSRKSPTSVSLAELFRVGSSNPELDGGRQRLINAQFLHRELRVRTSQRAVELRTLPLGLSDVKHIIRVRQYYERIFERLDSLSVPLTLEDDNEFTKDLETIVLSGHADVIQNMALGVREFRTALGSRGFTKSVRNAVDLHLNRFFIARIGLRFLIEHHVASRDPVDGYSGMIASACSPFKVIKRSADDAAHTCRFHLGDAPDVRVIGDPDLTFTYVPYHLHYIVFELLKNSMRATVERHGDSDRLPSIQVVVARGNHDITVKIGDEGGGMRFEEAKKCWSYLHSTAPPPPEIDDDTSGLRGGGGSTVGALAGYGFGLPLSRLYSRYFGGDLHLMSMEGHGTDAYVHLNRLGTDTENLPRKVLNSPSSTNSSSETKWWGE